MACSVCSELFAIVTNENEENGETSQKLVFDQLRYTEKGEFDVLLNNVSQVAAVVSRIEVMVVKDHEIELSPLMFGVNLRIPIEDLQKGETKNLEAVIEIPVGRAERLLISLETTRILTV